MLLVFPLMDFDLAALPRCLEPANKWFLRPRAIVIDLFSRRVVGWSMSAG